MPRISISPRSSRRWVCKTFFFDEFLGDDFVVAGPKHGVGMVKNNMREWCGVDVRVVLGRGADDSRDVVVLGRMVRWGRDGVELESRDRLI